MKMNRIAILSAFLAAPLLAYGQAPAPKNDKAVQEVIEPALEPLAERHCETVLLTIDNGVGKNAAHRFLENVFRCQSPHFEVLGHRGGKLQQNMIQQRNAKLDRVRHGHLISLQQEIIGQ